LKEEKEVVYISFGFLILVSIGREPYLCKKELHGLKECLEKEEKTKIN